MIDAIAEAIRTTPGVSLLDVDAGVSTNRTVYTFVGSPAAVVEGALAGARVAFKLIDMRKHKGEHRRLGALDVISFHFPFHFPFHFSFYHVGLSFYSSQWSYNG